MLYRNCVRQKWRHYLGQIFPILRDGHAYVHVPAPRVSSPRRLSRLFSTSKFPKPARQSAGDRTADVPPTMSFWALALHKRGNSKNGDARRDRRGGTGGFYDCKARRYRRFRVPHAPILQCTLLVCPLLFDRPSPFRSFSPCIWLALDSFPLSSPNNFCLFSSQLVRILSPYPP